MAMELCCRGATSATTSLVSISWSNSISSNSVHPISICQPKRAIKALCLATNTNSNGNGSTNQPRKGNQMTVSITGATGFIGKRLVQKLAASRKSSCPGVDRIEIKSSISFSWEFPGIVIAEEPGWKDCTQGSTVVVNLAGTPVSTR